jgi:hypothetical protein
MTNSNSDVHANTISTPAVMNPVGKHGGRVRVVQGAFELTATLFDADGDTVILARLPSNSRITEIKIANDDLDGATASVFNLGIAQTNGTIDDEDYFASLVTQLQGAIRLTSLFDEAIAAANIADVGKRLWEMAGDSTDPGGMKDIVMYQTATAGSAADGTLAFQIFYTID